MSKRERIEALEARVAALEARPYHGVLCVECGYRLDEPEMCTAENPVSLMACTLAKGHVGSHQTWTPEGFPLATWINDGQPSNSPGGLGAPTDNTPGGEVCEAAHTSGLACTLDLDHDGQHVATGGPGMVLQTWTDPEPDAEVIDAQIVCGASRIIDGVMRYCDSGADHDGEHVSEGRARRTWTDLAPVPQWRVSVDAWAESGVLGEAEDPLAAVLWLLHRVSLLQGVDHSEVADALARIVAVAEGQVGDGWKADPGRVPHGHWGIAWLLAPLSHEPPNWVVVADRAAAWLRSLTDGAS